MRLQRMINMKLELKHLAPYLPYGLKMSRNGFTGNLIQIKNPKETDLLEIFEFQVSCSNWWENTEDVNHYKPILRPLSDLVKEIEINEERFAPMNWMEKNIDKSIRFYRSLNGDLEIDIDTDNYSQVINLFCGYDAVQKLFEWNFDVFNLIEEGLAIDINTLKQTT